LAAKSDSIESILNEHLSVLEVYEAFYARLITERSCLPEEAKSVFAAIQSTVAFHFSNVMEREIAKGTVKKLPIHMLFNTWLGLVHYYLLNKEFFSSPSESVIKKHRVELVSAYLDLISIERRLG
jgi:hypothetical protein